jgi:DNA-binding transcriptional LysR family regulator
MLSFNSSVPQIDTSIQGYGIANRQEMLPKDIAPAVLDDWRDPSKGYHFYYPIRHQMSPAMALVVDALRHRS